MVVRKDLLPLPISIDENIIETACIIFQLMVAPASALTSNFHLDDPALNLGTLKSSAHTRYQSAALTSATAG